MYEIDVVRAQQCRLELARLLAIAVLRLAAEKQQAAAESHQASEKKSPDGLDDS